MIITDISKTNGLYIKKGSELVQNNDNESNNRKLNPEKKSFSFKDLFKKKD
jgi:hypothetical protein